VHTAIFPEGPKMTTGVSAWQQAGHLHVWRYAEARHGWHGWQWSADPAGAASLRNLLDRMQGGEPCYRTLRLEPLTEAVLAVPGARHAVTELCARLRVDYRPDRADLQLEPDGDTLMLTLGDGRLRMLASALAQVEVGEGDFGIAASDDRKADPWLFWWMPGIAYSAGRRSR
jgi:hypothetical protein